MEFSVYCTGFVMSFSLIVAIGAQNLFIIKLGLQNRNVLLASSIAAFCDIMLIMLGTFFMARLMEAVPGIADLTKWVGCLFLVGYGLLSLRNALRRHPSGWDNTEHELDKRLARSKLQGNRRIVATILAFTLLNPHVYLDTFLIMGNFASRFSTAGRWAFIAGAGTASCVWFFPLGFAARRAARLFRNPIMTRSFDAVVGLIMLSIAWALYTLPLEHIGLEH